MKADSPSSPPLNRAIINAIAMRVLVQKVEWLLGRFSPGGHTLGKVTNKHKIFFLKNSFIYFWLYWVFSTTCRAFASCSEQGLLSSCGASHCSGFPCCKAWALYSMWPLVIVVHELSCPLARGIFPDQGLNPCSLIGRWILYHMYH